MILEHGERRRNGFDANLSAEEAEDHDRESNIQLYYDQLLERETERQWRDLHPRAATIDTNSKAFNALASKIERDDPGHLISLAELWYENQKLHKEKGEHHLTGLANGTTAEVVFNSLRERKKMSGTTIVVRLDLDGFKLINDKLGHAIGDKTLIKVADQLQKAIKNIRPTDVPIHFSGDEFGFILTNVKQALDANGQPLSLEETAEKIVARIVSHIEEVTVPNNINPSGHLTASAGFTILKEKGSKMHKFSFYNHQADTAALRAKDFKHVPNLAAGSKRVVSADNLDKIIHDHQLNEEDLSRSTILASFERVVAGMIQNSGLTPAEEAEVRKKINEVAEIGARGAKRKKSSGKN